jgi:hypothetical protein
MQNPTSTISEFVVPPTTAWSLRAWPPLLWQAGEPALARFHHLSTRVATMAEHAGVPAGQTVWAANAADGDAGMAWDWVQITRGVVAIADPMSVVTNVRLIGDGGEVLTAQEAARFLNELVHKLPWQREVQRVISALVN